MEDFRQGLGLVPGEDLADEAADDRFGLEGLSSPVVLQHAITIAVERLVDADADSAVVRPGKAGELEDRLQRNLLNQRLNTALVRRAERLSGGL
jgi:hypothetical protein